MQFAPLAGTARRLKAALPAALQPRGSFNYTFGFRLPDALS